MNNDKSDRPVVKPPFSIRQDPAQHEEFFALQTGISDGLQPLLRSWAIKMYSDSERGDIRLAKLTNLELLIDQQITPDGLRSSDILFGDALTKDRTLLLDAIDVALRWADDTDAGILEHFLVKARSEYCVGHDENGDYEIQLRQPQEMTALIETEANQPRRAAEHLRNAWSKCFGRNPDPKGACREAVEAIEVAAKPVVIPNDPLATLGKMCSAIRLKPEKWVTDSEFDGSVETILGMMEMVWKGHLRHGDESVPSEVSQEAAEMTVQTAVLLVSWFRSGRIRSRK